MVGKLKEHANLVAALITAVLVICAYYTTVWLGSSALSYYTALPALLVILITAIARVNDIQKDQVSKRWQVRRAGLSIIAGASAVLMIAPFAGASLSWGTVALCWGFALTWLTTPEMPPWWRWISGRDQG